MHKIAFSHGDVIEKLKSRPLAKDEKRSGTRVTVWPDAKYFDSPNIPLADLQRLLRSKAVLLPGVKVTLINAKNGKENEVQTWQYAQGLRGYLVASLAQASHADPQIP